MPMNPTPTIPILTVMRFSLFFSRFLQSGDLMRLMVLTDFTDFWDVFWDGFSASPGGLSSCTFSKVYRKRVTSAGGHEQFFVAATLWDLFDANSGSDRAASACSSVTATKGGVSVVASSLMATPR